MIWMAKSPLKETSVSRARGNRKSILINSDHETNLNSQYHGICGAGGFDVRLLDSRGNQ